MNKQRVVITDMESLTPTGWLKDSIKFLNYNCFPNQFIKFPFDPRLENPVITKTMNKETYFAYLTIIRILNRNPFLLDTDDIGLCIGNTFPTPLDLSSTSNIFKSLGNTVAVNLAKTFQIKSDIIPISNSCATSLTALIEGYKQVQSGYTSMMLVGGCDQLSNQMFDVFTKLRLLSNEYKCKSFSVNRTGTVLAEGASIFLLEEYHHAKDRNAHIYGEILGTGMSMSDSLSKSSVSSIKDCMLDAIYDAETIVEDVIPITIIDTHGTGTVYGDLTEAEAINQLTDDACIYAWKHIFNHTLAASGLFELGLTISLTSRNLRFTDIRNNYPTILKPHIVYNDYSNNYILKNSIGLGGINTSVVVKV